MTVKDIAYFIYLALMVINSLIIGSAGLTLRNWQVWAIALTTVIIYLCGYIRGGNF